MKKTIVMAIMLMASMGLTYAQQVKKVDANTYEVISQRRTSSKGSSYTPTDIKLKDGDTTYVVYTHEFTRGARAGQTGYFIQKKSKKTGKTYWKEIKLD